MSRYSVIRCRNCSALVGGFSGEKTRTCKLCGYLSKVKGRRIFGRFEFPADLAAWLQAVKLQGERVG